MLSLVSFESELQTAQIIIKFVELDIDSYCNPIDWNSIIEAATSGKASISYIDRYCM